MTTRKKVTIEFFIDGPPFKRECSFHIKEIKNLTNKQMTNAYKKIGRQHGNLYSALESMNKELTKIGEKGERAEDIKLTKSQERELDKLTGNFFEDIFEKQKKK